MSAVPVSRWLHINYLALNEWAAWPAPIWAAAGRADPPIVIPGDLGQLALHVSTRLNMILQAHKRLNEDCQRLLAHAAQREPRYDSTPTQDGYAFKIPDEVTFRLLLDVDSVLFEINACCEQISRLVEQVYNLVGRKIPGSNTNKLIQKILASQAADLSWFRQLDHHRNFFIHSGTPYFAIDLSRAAENTYDLLIMRENLRSFEDEQRFVRLSTIGTIAKGFFESLRVLQRYLIGVFDRARAT